MTSADDLLACCLCGRPQAEVDRRVGGERGAVCSSCVPWAVAVLDAGGERSRRLTPSPAKPKKRVPASPCGEPTSLRRSVHDRPGSERRELRAQRASRILLPPSMTICS